MSDKTTVVASCQEPEATVAALDARVRVAARRSVAAMHAVGRLGRGVDAVAARPQRLDGVQDREEHEDGPEEEAESNGGLEGAAGRRGAAVGGSGEDGEGDGAGEPEDGGDDEEGDRGEAVEDARVVEGHEADVGQDEEGPDRVEDHEVDNVGRAGAVAIAPAPPVVEDGGDCAVVVSIATGNGKDLAWEGERREAGDGAGAGRLGGKMGGIVRLSRTVGGQAELHDGEDGCHDVGDGHETGNGHFDCRVWGSGLPRCGCWSLGAKARCWFAGRHEGGRQRSKVVGCKIEKRVCEAKDKMLSTQAANGGGITKLLRQAPWASQAGKEGQRFLVSPGEPRPRVVRDSSQKSGPE